MLTKKNQRPKNNYKHYSQKLNLGQRLNNKKSPKAELHQSSYIPLQSNAAQ